MSFSACITNTASRVYAMAEEGSTILVIPVNTLNELLLKFPSFHGYFQKLYQMRYEDLIGTIDQLVFRKFDERLIQYLLEKSGKLDLRVLKLTHKQIADDLGTLREVVSRTLKKIEMDGKIQILRNEIRIL